MSLMPSQHCADTIKGFETCRLKAFLPTPNDVPTIGWGTAGPDIHLGMVWTQRQCDSRFFGDLMRFGTSVAGMVSSVTNQNQFDALVSFAYNEGAHALHESNLLVLHNAGKYPLAAEQFKLWVFQRGVKLNGLVSRRAKEAQLYLTPVIQKGEAA